MSFSINCLEITATKAQWESSENLYKNLLSEEDYKGLEDDAPFKKRFFFNDFYEHNKRGKLKKSSNPFSSDLFFGKNVNVQAIVGKNGSGKSSLMDLMYMAINNLSFMFERGKDRPGADPLFFVPNLHIKLYFSLNEKECFLKCDNSSVILTDGTKKYSFKKSDTRENIEKFNNEQLSDLVQIFFYSIVSNYSMQSFISSNYIADVYCYNKAPKSKYSQTYKSWINSIFHKNDGYIRSIVLNPYRSNGRINLENELELSKDRITSLLIWYNEQRAFAKLKNEPFRSPFSPYQFYRFEFYYKSNFVYEKYLNYFSTEKERKWFKKIIKNEHDLAAFVLGNANCFLFNELKNLFYLPPITSSSNFSSKISYVYLVIKILSIVKKYPNYLKFNGCFRLDFVRILNIRQLMLVVDDKKKLQELLQTIKRDTSHITKKIWRTMNFLRIAHAEEWTDGKRSWKEYHEKLKSWYCGMGSPYVTLYSEYINDKWLKFLSPFYTGGDKIGAFVMPSSIDVALLPSFFSYDLYLSEINEIGQILKKDVPYHGLSSGEVQMLQTLSIHAYHLENLFSNTESNIDDRPKYSNVNLVFDEVEISFHPEYQRQFVYRLLTMLNSLKYNFYSINVFIITHSPFILSDIPSNRVLYMNEGSMSERKNEEDPLSDKETFGQNIGSLLYNSFFLKYYVGDFAKKKINEILDEFDRNRSMPREKFERKIQIFGDSLLKRQMMNYFDLHKA